MKDNNTDYQNDNSRNNSNISLSMAVISVIATLLPIIIGLALWNKLPDELPVHWGINDEAVSHKGRCNADQEDPLEVIIPPVGPAFLAGVLALFAGLEVFGVDIAFVTVACHGAVSSKF